MNRADIIRKVARELVSAAEADIAVRTVFDSIGEALLDGEKVTISNFGTFQPKLRKARLFRNPKTGEPVGVSPRKTVRFKPSDNILR